MSIEQIKKAAKNLQRLLPGFLEKHKPPFVLTAVQQLTCQMSGYPNMEVATSAMQRQDDETSDPMGRFYKYPWMEVDPSALMACVTGRPRTEFKLDVVGRGQAMKWFETELEAWDRNSMTPLVVVVTAGGGGSDLVHDLSEGPFRNSKNPIFHMTSFATLNQRTGITLNWLNGWALDDVKSVLKEMVRAVCSTNQFTACSSAIDVVVEQVDGDLPAPEVVDEEEWAPGRGAARLSVGALSAKLRALIALSEGGWSKHYPEDFASEFEDDDGDPAPRFVAAYAEQDLRHLLAPLESLLVRLAALGDGEGHGSSLGYREHADNLEFDTFGAAEFVMVEMESKRLDHAVAMAVLSKVAATMEDRHSWNPESKSMVRVVLVTH